MSDIRSEILETVDNGTMTHQVILEELIQFLDTDTLKQFKSESFGNEGF